MNETQNCILRIFHKVDSLCRRHDITYFAIGGTAIGAVRHHGFIPWDDDLDIAIPIEQYDRFLKLAEEELAPELEVVTYKGRPHYQHMFAKIQDPGTTFIEGYKKHYPDTYTGVWVDIFPLSGALASKIGQSILFKRMQLLGKFNFKVKFSLSAYHHLRWKLLWHMVAPFRKWYPDFFLDKWHSLLVKHPSETAKYVWAGAVACKKVVYLRTWFSSSIDMPFEDIMISMPVGYDEMLTQVFGDYMTLPPEDERATHGGYIDLEHPVSDYQSGKLKVPEGYFKEHGYE